jgi:hypothetical protein
MSKEGMNADLAEGDEAVEGAAPVVQRIPKTLLNNAPTDPNGPEFEFKETCESCLARKPRGLSMDKGMNLACQFVLSR